MPVPIRYAVVWDATPGRPEIIKADSYLEFIGILERLVIERGPFELIYRVYR